jgi:hypothetical protein
MQPMILLRQPLKSKKIMGHQITAIIAKDTINRKVAESYDLPVFVHNGYAIIGLEARHSDYWAEKLGINNEADNEIILNCPVTHFFAKELGLEKYAIVYTDYWAGIGTQFATVFEKDRVIMPETEEGINQALKMLGVQRVDGQDEFDSISLGNYRDFELYFEKYWS